MELEELLTLLARFDASSLTGLDVTLGETRVKLQKAAAPAVPLAPQPVAAPAAAGTPPPDAGTLITAPLVGTFYAGPAPEKPPFAPVGSTIRKGSTVCVLEAMKMMSEIPAPCDCVIDAVLCTDGALADYGAPLFRVRPI